MRTVILSFLLLATGSANAPNHWEHKNGAWECVTDASRGTVLGKVQFVGSAFIAYVANAQIGTAASWADAKKLVEQAVGGCPAIG